MTGAHYRRRSGSGKRRSRSGKMRLLFYCGLDFRAGKRVGINRVISADAGRRTVGYRQAGTGLFFGVSVTCMRYLDLLSLYERVLLFLPLFQSVTEPVDIPVVAVARNGSRVGAASTTDTVTVKHERGCQ